MSRAVDRHVRTDSPLQGAADKVLKSSVCLAVTVVLSLLQAAEPEMTQSTVPAPHPIHSVFIPGILLCSHLLFCFTDNCTLISTEMLKLQRDFLCVTHLHTHNLDEGD